ncbi:MAG: hypothetical protein KDD49_09310 [Bacteroidetes bacterium]|nr:hypothetical protein [Bacteroidota bacterium]MCB9043612.1 hypothetical protein [Chitinophagales bacterium]
MQLIEVTNVQQARAFNDMARDIYANDKNWIQPLRQDIEAVFDRNKNPFFQQGDAIRWLLYNPQGNVIGRVAAFYRNAPVSDEEIAAGGMGFFECINDTEAAFLLFDACKNWLEKYGFNAMDGPINFGERDRWWGLLVDGFLPPVYGMFYHPAYYQNLFESYGFQMYFKQFTFGRKVDTPMQERFERYAQRILDNQDFHFTTATEKSLSDYAEDFRIIYNAAWGHSFENFKPITAEKAQSLFKKMKPIIDTSCIVFGYHQQKPIAFYISLPEINQIVTHLHGNLNWWGKLKFWWLQRNGTVNRLLGLIFGVVPEFQKKGIEGALIKTMGNSIQYKGKYLYTELNWIGDFNPKMITVTRLLEAEKIKTHHTYRFLFDRNRPFERLAIHNS